jgi:hypothetical protein
MLKGKVCSIQTPATNMYYTIYKTTNTLNGKFYVGKHETKNPFDSYIGSGVALLRAVEKYGRKHFVKDVLHIYTTGREMDLAEKILVVVDSEVSYNLGRGGEGGPMFLGRKHSAETKLKVGASSKIRKHKKTKEQLDSERVSRYSKNNGSWFSKETIEKIRLAKINFGKGQ